MFLFFFLKSQSCCFNFLKSQYSLFLLFENLLLAFSFEKLIPAVLILFEKIMLALSIIFEKLVLAASNF